jgi:hypothetical protein
MKLVYVDISVVLPDEGETTLVKDIYNRIVWIVAYQILAK